MVRKILASAVVVSSMWVLWPAFAQQPASTFFTGADPRAIKFQPIDVGRANRAPDMNRMIRPAHQPQGFVLSNFFRTMTIGSWPPKVASTPILKESPYSKVIRPKKDKK